ICNMILGPTTASALRADTAPFKDVAADNQYAGYIAYCVQQGITAGYTDGTYRPAAPLTNFAFMKMLLGALGYDQNTEGYVGGNCFINVAKQAIGLGLNKGLLVDFD
ncbi:S-layer homology domain-containing protein, partial [Oscillibacter valericigenes]|uniref:S-layer homology domain-containing protein n=1 Tax=Oscillibacter valericigenes TaxID=351091 RepID=UPI001F25819F